LEREEKKHRLELEAIPSSSSISSICSFVSAHSESADFYQPSTGNQPFLLDFSPKRGQPSLPPKLRVSIHIHQHSCSKNFARTVSNNNMLTIPRFLISPPTLTPSTSAISLLSQRSLKQLYKRYCKLMPNLDDKIDVNLDVSVTVCSHRGKLTPNKQYKCYVLAPKM
jgi:hypothetical protein